MTAFDIPQLVLGPEGEAVLYIPDDRSPPDPMRDARMIKIALKLRESSDLTGLTVARDRRAFRRAFLQRFITPFMDLANSFAQLAGPVGPWIEKNEASLGAPFFAAQWLVANGAVQTFQVLASEASNSSFVPHEQAPAAVNHVLKREAAQKATATRTGDILGWLLAVWVQRVFEERSFDRYCAVAADLLVDISLSDDVLIAAGMKIKEWVGLFKLGEPGTIVAQYVYEAVLAVLCQTHGKRNPRTAEWTKVLFRYEYFRRVDGNDESMLLAPEIVRSTLDEPIFWSAVRSIGGRSSGINEESMSLHSHLLETVERLFPEQVQVFSRWVFRFADSKLDKDVLKGIGELLQTALSALPQTAPLQALLFGFQQYRPHLLEAVVDALDASLDATGADGNDRLICFRYAIEALNHAHRYLASLAVAHKVEQLLSANPEAGGTIRAHLLNEVGNCFRYAGKFTEALQRYDAALTLWGKDASALNTRVILRNRAIVLRGLHRYAAAQEIFAELRPHAHDAELVGLVTSEAICLAEMGESRKALNLLDAHKPLIENASTADPNVRQAMLFYAQLLLSYGRTSEAQPLISRISALGNRFPSVLDQATTATLAPNPAPDAGLPERERVLQRRQTIDALKQGLANARTLAGVPETMIAFAMELGDVLDSDGRADESEPMVREVWDQAESLGATKAWVLALPVFRYAMNRDDRRQAAKDLLRGMSHLSETLWEVAEEGDPISLLAPNAEAVDYLATNILKGISPSSPATATALRVAAELRAAPLLTPRLRRLASLPPAVADMTGETERLVVLLAETPCVILQFVAMTDDIGVLVTRPGEDGALNTELRELAVDAKKAHRIGGRLAYALRRAAPDDSDLDLSHVVGWLDLRDRLRSLVVDLPESLPLCIVPGPLGSTMPTLALGGMRALCFVPSIGALLAMRARRRTLSGGLCWRPQSMFAFAVWFDRERATEAASLSAMTDQGATLAAERGLSYSSAVGREGTGERLLTGLAEAELTCIACHGRILPDAEAIDLIVAGEGRLPPADLTHILAHRNAPHILGWQRLATLPSASTVVMSTACNSGLAVLHVGGERLGLERPLFSAGTLAYIAPQWPVPTVPIQEVATALLTRWLSSETLSLVDCVAAQRVASLGVGIPSLAAEAFAVFGDGL
ncbi:tetratricopeptide repeat protein [Paraburkholderia kururiensis]|uniref:tetratricopeptide repeat protein n=1 Tax=Paraburkholderia kururiensis TaxID=984307 RepID=UPI001386651F|nr:tetratricopeptide repeat protein [Paraburkholderia kururiensis]